MNLDWKKFIAHLIEKGGRPGKTRDVTMMQGTLKWLIEKGAVCPGQTQRDWCKDIAKELGVDLTQFAEDGGGEAKPARAEEPSGDVRFDDGDNLAIKYAGSTEFEIHHMGDVFARVTTDSNGARAIIRALTDAAKRGYVMKKGTENDLPFA